SRLNSSTMHRLRCGFLFLTLVACHPPLLSAYDNIQLKQTLLSPVTGQAFSPYAVAVDHSGRYWVTDSENNRLVVYSSAGVFLERDGQPGSAPAELSHPHGIAADSEGLIYLADTGND